MHNTHIKAAVPELLDSILAIVGIFNEPERDAAMLTQAGLSLERALLPLLVLIDRLGPIGVVEVSGRIGRDYTTVSRQVARLEELGLVQRSVGTSDRRVRVAEVTQKGKSTTAAIDAVRIEMALELFRDWSQQDLDDLVRLTKRLAQGMDDTKKRTKAPPRF